MSRRTVLMRVMVVLVAIEVLVIGGLVMWPLLDEPAASSGQWLIVAATPQHTGVPLYLQQELCSCVPSESGNPYLVVSRAYNPLFSGYAAHKSDGALNYGVFCQACHGVAGRGVLNQAPPLVNNAMVAQMDDAALLRLIIDGRSVDAPDNHSGRAMPPRGGFPNLREDQIRSVIAYLRALAA